MHSKVVKHNNAKTLRLILGDQLNSNHSWFSTKDDSIVKLLDSNLTKLIPENFQETVLMIFYKDKNVDLEEIKNKLNYSN